MQTYKEVVSKFKEKNSKTPKTTWRYESWGDSYEQGGRVGYQEAGVVARKSPIKINEETFKKIDNFIAKSEGTLSKKALGESLGYKIVEKGKTAGQGGLNKVIKAWEESRGKTFEFKPAKFTADSPKVKQVIDLFESGMSKRAIEFKTGISRKETVNIFRQFAPEYIGDVNLPSGEGKNAVKNRRKKIIKELTDYWKDKPGGKKILEEMNQKLRGIKLKNAEIANMSDEAILKNKMFKEAMNLDVRGLKAGEGINFNRYANLTDAEYVAKVRGLAATNQFYQPEHFIAINKKNPASMLPKNIYTAVGKIGGQMESMKNFMASNPNDKRVSQIAKLFKSQNMMDSKGMLGEGFSKFAKKMPKTAGALAKTGRFLGFGVEAGLIPLAVAAEGLYQNFKDKRDLKKSLDQMVKNKLITQEQNDVLLEGFRQESRDIGGVGLETYAIEQPNVQEKLEEIGYGDRTQLLKAARAPIADIREQDALAKQLKQQEIEKRTKEAYEDAIGRRTVEFKKGGRVSFKFGSMGRRGFLKLLAALGIGTAGAKAGLLGLSKVAGKKAAVKAGADIATGTQGMPSWFPALVNKIIKEGDDVTGKLATKERELVYTKKLPDGEEATVYRDLDTGDIRIDYDSVYNMGEGTAPVSLEYKAGQVIDSGKMAGQKTKPEFSAVESEPVSYIHGPDDYSIEWDGSNVVGKVDDLVSDTSKLKNYAESKKPTIKEIVTRKRKIDEVDAIHKNETDYISTKQGEGEWDDYLPDIDDID